MTSTIKMILLLSSFALVMMGCRQYSEGGNQHVHSEQDLKPISIKVVVINMFEIGEDEGDKAGEFQLWKTGQKLDTCLPFDVSHHPICINENTGVMGVVTGMGTAKATAAVMALGLDPRFNLKDAYWLVAGIAGVDPHDASIGSAIWARWLVDGDLAHEIDAREIPSDWNTGYFPLFDTKPLHHTDTYDLTALNRHGQATNGEVYQLNEELSDWAFNLTKNVQLDDSNAMQILREKYISFPNAQKPPFVLQGDNLSASTFWHGKLLNQWANDWVHYWTGGEGNFVTSGMEDTGSYQAMIYLDKINKVDKSRFMVLRTASNYSMEPTGLTPIQNLRLESGENGYAGMKPSLSAAYKVGSMVVDTLIGNWDIYKETLPYEMEEKPH